MSVFVEPVPYLFAHEFVIGGWRRVEFVYGGRTDQNRRWLDLCGGERLRSLRRRYRRGDLRAAVEAMGCAPMARAA